MVLILDEAQDLEGFSVETVRPVISQLHKGSHGGPFLAVFAGLAYSNTVLQERGISRFSRGHESTLAALTSEEATEIVLRMLAEFRVRGDKELKNQWARILANESAAGRSTFMSPCRHLHCSFFLHQHPEGWNRSTATSDPEVLRASVRAREQYYERRIDEKLVVAPDLIAETLRRIGSGAFRANVLAHIDEAAQPGHGPKSLPKDHDAEMFLDRMIRRGVLQYAPGHKLVCPIPSLRDYVERLANRITSRAQFQSAGS